MARKKRKVKKEETYEFVPPEFDERHFLLKDLQVTKVLWAVTALAVVMGLVGAFFANMSGVVAVGFLVMLVSLLGLKQVLALLRFDVDAVEGKGMIGNYILFFFLFLGVWIVCMNPPIADYTAPHISDVGIYYEVGGEEVAATFAGGIYTVEGDGLMMIEIRAKVVDNTPLSNIVLEWGSERFTMSHLGDHIYGYEVEVNAALSGSGTSHNFAILATDDANNSTETIHYWARIIKV